MQRDFNRECQSGPGTTRYDSASRNSVGSSEVGGDEAEAEAEAESVEVVIFLDR